jgi:hypothetical protein
MAEMIIDAKKEKKQRNGSYAEYFTTAFSPKLKTTGEIEEMRDEKMRKASILSLKGSIFPRILLCANTVLSL